MLGRRLPLYKKFKKNPINKPLAEWAKEARMKAGLDLYDAAKLLGVSHMCLHRYEKYPDSYGINPEMLGLLCAVYEAPATDARALIPNAEQNLYNFDIPEKITKYAQAHLGCGEKVAINLLESFIEQNRKLLKKSPHRINTVEFASALNKIGVEMSLLKTLEIIVFILELERIGVPITMEILKQKLESLDKNS